MRASRERSPAVMFAYRSFCCWNSSKSPRRKDVASKAACPVWPLFESAVFVDRCEGAECAALFCELGALCIQPSETLSPQILNYSERILSIYVGTTSCIRLFFAYQRRLFNEKFLGVLALRQRARTTWGTRREIPRVRGPALSRVAEARSAKRP